MKTKRVKNIEVKNDKLVISFDDSPNTETEIDLGKIIEKNTKPLEKRLEDQEIITDDDFIRQNMTNRQNMMQNYRQNYRQIPLCINIIP